MGILAEAVERGVERALARQQAQVENAKLITTFVAGIAAALDASALQVRGSSSLTVASSISLVLAILFVIAILLADRLTDANYAAVVTDAKAQGLDDAETVNRLRTASANAVDVNDSVVFGIRCLTVAQLMLALASAVLAVLALVLPAAAG